MAQQLVPVVITVHADAGKVGRLFGSVMPAEIVAAVEAQTSVVLDRHKLIVHEPISRWGHTRSVSTSTRRSSSC